ncbi:MAG: PilZ domain-containing protein [Gammaproteobacteria bacterium]
MREKRRFVRTPISVQVKIWHESVGETVLTTRDVSDGGVFLVTAGHPVPPVGTIIQGQVQGPVEDLPVVAMEVVRVVPDGIGLRFLRDTDE